MSEIEILSPKGCKPEDIKHDITQSVGQIIDIATFPNGFVMTTTITGGNIDIKTSSPLIKINDSTYQVPD